MICTRPDCLRDVHCRGLCTAHYTAARREGRFAYREPTEVLAHLTKLRERGWTWGQIADHAGVSSEVPRRLAAGRTRQLWAETADLLLAVPLDSTVESRRGIDPTGSRRRVQALAWMGWPAEEIARRVGVAKGTLQTSILPSRRISAALAGRITTVYGQLELTPGPSTKAAAKARALGFAPPLAWDETTIDNPRARPRGVAA